MNDDQWMAEAECAKRQLDPETFYLRKYQQSINDRKIRYAKSVCRACDVRLECLKYAIAHNEKYGIWGGMTVHERRRYFPRKVRHMVARWWFKQHPGAYPVPPPGHYMPRSRRSVSSDEEDLAS